MEEIKKLFTSESVSEGHPDKVCDKIADAILDYCLAHDENSRVACEVFATEEQIVIGGEITTNCKPDYEEIARKVLKDIGYTDKKLGIGADTCKVLVLVKTQSQDISQAVTNHDFLETGAGDQGFVFGYATYETDGYYPLAISLAHKVMRVATHKRKTGEFKWARPDMKSQVTVDYTDPKHLRIETILVSIQHDEDFNETEFKDYVKNEILIPSAKSFGLNTDFKCLINPSGRFVIGGPLGDTGVTGRKIIVDTYGGTARHGGGAFSGKDPTKVDRSGAYMARYIAKNLVAAGAADRMEVQIAYAIGVAKPVSVGVSTFKTAHYDDKKILEVINKVFDCRPGAIIKQFSLNKPTFLYQEVTNYGHFGRPDINLPWEKLDKVEEIKRLLK